MSNELQGQLEGFTLVTSRKPDDLDAFTEALVDTFSKTSNAS